MGNKASSEHHQYNQARANRPHNQSKSSRSTNNSNRQPNGNSFSNQSNSGSLNSNENLQSILANNNSSNNINRRESSSNPSKPNKINQNHESNNINVNNNNKSSNQSSSPEHSSNSPNKTPSIPNSLTIGSTSASISASAASNSQTGSNSALVSGSHLQPAGGAASQQTQHSQQAGTGTGAASGDGQMGSAAINIASPSNNSINLPDGGDINSFFSLFGRNGSQARSNPVGGISPGTSLSDSSSSNNLQSNEISNFFQQLFATSHTSTDATENTNSRNLAGLFRHSRSNQMSSSSIVLPNSQRLRIFERNGVRFAYINGRLIPITSESKTCQYCNKKINPLTEDYEIHVVKCMTKPRIKNNTFELKQTDEKDQELLGQECTICFEEYSLGDTLARLECFCVFHKACLDNWLSRKQCCPLHYHLEEDE